MPHSILKRTILSPEFIYLNDPLASYYQEDGTNLRRMFLKSPMKLGVVLASALDVSIHSQKNRPHLGVDYAAPTGTLLDPLAMGESSLLAVTAARVK